MYNLPARILIKIYNPIIFRQEDRTGLHNQLKRYSELFPDSVS